MKTLIVYDSKHGNTKKIAETVCNTLNKETTALHVNEAKISDLDDIDLLIVGSPTKGGILTHAINEFIQKIPTDRLNGVGVAAFDTRITKENCGFFLRLFMEIFDFSARRIIENLVSKGGYAVARPERFFVEGKQGPLQRGELKRASSWASAIIK